MVQYHTVFPKNLILILYISEVWEHNPVLKWICKNENFKDPEVIFDSLDIEPSTEEIFSSLDSIIGEYFNNASLEDFLDSVEGLMVRRERNRILEKLIENSLEHKNEYRELASKAIKFCREQNYWNEIEVARAFCVSFFKNIFNPHLI